MDQIAQSHATSPLVDMYSKSACCSLICDRDSLQKFGHRLREQKDKN